MTNHCHENRWCRPTEAHVYENRAKCINAVMRVGLVALVQVLSGTTTNKSQCRTRAASFLCEGQWAIHHSLFHKVGECSMPQNY